MEKKIKLAECSNILKMCVENSFNSESGMYFFETDDLIESIKNGEITKQDWEQFEKEINDYGLIDNNVIEVATDFDSVIDDKENIDCAITCYQALPTYFEMENTLNNQFPDENFRKAILEEVFNIKGVSDLTPLHLSKISEEERLLIPNSKINDLTGIENFKNLKILDVSYNPLEELNVENVDTLKKIYAHNCSLSKIKVPHKDKTELTYLDVTDNQLVNLDLEGQSSLVYAFGSNNNLKDIQLQECEDLKFLVCNNNRLTKIDVSDCYNLIQFECDRNNLRNLNLENNEDLLLLSCDANELVKLDVSHCEKLKNLSCDSNWIENLNITGLNDLEEISCKGNDRSPHDLLNENNDYSVEEVKTEYKANSKEKKDEQIENLFNLIKSGVTELSSPEHLYDLWKFQSQFHQYSINNQLLIKEQYPTAKQIGSFAKWKELGFSVKKGEKSIKILAPMNIKLFESENEWKTISKATPKEKELIAKGLIETRTLTRFKETSVFDIQQTTAKTEDYPKLMRWLPIEGDEHKDTLDNLMNFFGDKYDIEFLHYSHDSSNGFYGKTIDGRNQIGLKVENDPNQKVVTLLHEMGHFLLKHQDENSHLSRNVKEMEAESVAYITSFQFGIEEKREQTEVYITSWLREIGDTDSKLDVMKNSFARINDVCKVLMADIDIVMEEQLNLNQENNLDLEQ